MAPKELTPHQVSKGLSYVHKEPAFLARMKGNSQVKEKAKQKFVDYEDGQDDDDYNELEGAQVVELDSKGQVIHKDTETKDDTEDEDNKEEDVDQGPAVDDNGRLLFRPTKKKKTTLVSTKRSLEEAIEDHRKDKNTKKSKKKSKKQAPMTLSFDPEEWII